MHVAFLLLLGFGVKPLGYDALLYSIIRRWYSSLSSVMVHAITDLIAKYRQHSGAWICVISLLGPKAEHDETGRICKTSQSGVTPSSSLQACFSLVPPNFARHLPGNTLRYAAILHNRLSSYAINTLTLLRVRGRRWLHKSPWYLPI